MAWNLVVVAVSFATLLVLVRLLRPLADLPTTFLFLAIWGRYLVSGLHDYTMIPLFADVRGVTLYSIFIVLCGALLIPKSYLLIRHLFPFYLFFALAVISGLLNFEFIGTTDELARWGFFMTVALLTYRAFLLFGFDKIIRIFMIATMTPFILQLFGFLIGYRAVGHDGAVAYIGGYYADSSFSKILFTVICLCALIRARNELWPAALTLLALFGIYLTNYRTAIIGTLPIVAVVFMSIAMKFSTPVLRPLLFFAALLTLMLGMPLALQILPDRYDAISEFAGNLGTLFQSPEEFTPAERTLATGRVYIWSQYIDAWLHAPLLNQLIGFGPESYGKFPHSEYIAFLYEFGLFGLVLLLAIFGWQLILMAQVEDRVLAVRLMACMSGFALASVASMPIWAIEGLITLGLVCAATWAAVDGSLAPSGARLTPRPAPTSRTPIGGRWKGNRLDRRHLTSDQN